MKMPFGKHKGQDVNDLPEGYLLWLQSVELTPKLARAVRLAILLRGLHEHPIYTRPPFLVTLHIESRHMALVREIVDAGYKQVAKRLHPDQGGDPARMRELTDTVTQLRQQLQVTA